MGWGPRYLDPFINPSIYTLTCRHLWFLYFLILYFLYFQATSIDTRIMLLFPCKSRTQTSMEGYPRACLFSPLFGAVWEVKHRLSLFQKKPPILVSCHNHVPSLTCLFSKGKFSIWVRVEIPLLNLPISNIYCIQIFLQLSRELVSRQTIGRTGLFSALTHLSHEVLSNKKLSCLMWK